LGDLCRRQLYDVRLTAAAAQVSELAAVRPQNQAATDYRDVTGEDADYEPRGIRHGLIVALSVSGCDRAELV
jgi:hypothetical protein